MKTYKVIALSVGGLGNKIFSSGDTVAENNFKQGRADELVSQGFLQVIEEPVVEVVKKTDEDAAGENEKSFDEISKAEIIAELTARGIEFDTTANKKTLYALWIKK